MWFFAFSMYSIALKSRISFLLHHFSPAPGRNELRIYAINASASTGVAGFSVRAAAGASWMFLTNASTKASWTSFAQVGPVSIASFAGGVHPGPLPMNYLFPSGHTRIGQDLALTFRSVTILRTVVLLITRTASIAAIRTFLISKRELYLCCRLAIDIMKYEFLYKLAPMLSLGSQRIWLNRIDP